MESWKMENEHKKLPEITVKASLFSAEVRAWNHEKFTKKEISHALQLTCLILEKIVEKMFETLRRRLFTGYLLDFESQERNIYGDPEKVIETFSRKWKIELKSWEYRRKPEQCLSGASTVTERNELLLHARQQRQKREEYRKKAKSTVLIQAYARGYLTRDRVKRHERSCFDNILQEWNNKSPINSDVLSSLVKKLLFFYKEQEDASRLVVVSQYIFKEHATVIKLVSDSSTPWLWYLQGILNLNLNHMASIVKQRKLDSIAVSLRLLETYTSTEIVEKIIGCDKANHLMSKIFSYLIAKGYFKTLRYLFDEKTPPLLSESAKPPNPLIECLFEFLTKPLVFCSNMTSTDMNKMLQEFFLHIFSPKLTECVKWYILPALVELKSFPFCQILQNLQNFQSELSPDSVEEVYTSGVLYSILTLDKKHFWLNTQPNVGELSSYLHVLATLTRNICKLSLSSDTDELDDDELKEMALDEYIVAISMKEEIEILEECANLLNDNVRVQNLLMAIEEIEEPYFLQALCQVCHNMLISNKLAVHKYRLLYMLAFKPAFLRNLWSAIQNVSQVSIFGYSTPLVTLISRGIPMTPEEAEKIVPLLAVFSSLFSLFIATLHDSEFHGDENGVGGNQSTMPFSLPQLVTISKQLKEICLGLVDLAFPDSRAGIKETIRGIESQSISVQQTTLWSNLFKVTVGLVRQLHARDCRRQFCPEGHWISKQVQITLGGFQPTELAFRMRRTRGYQPFQTLRAFTREELEEGGPPLTTKEIRTATLLHELPFLVAFQERVMLFQTKILKDKMEHQGEGSHFLQGPSIQISVRRNYLYEDAFDNLSVENEPELRLVMRVQLVNKVGLGEAGIDGGGVFREFLSELLKTAFDPNRGFFRLTKDNMLYPNPNVHVIVEDFPKHYFFIGRMLGKALYENLLVELPFAEFFLSKLVGRHSNVDIHHLASFDPVMYRNLLFLKNYEGDVLDLGLDFIIMNEELGETRIEELKPGGSSIPVTSSNRIEYIHLMADYKLNKQIRAQCNAFRQGLADVIPLEWIQMFNNKELQVLISGAEIPVDVDDLRLHTNYAGGYAENHPTIKMFWKIVENFSDIQRRQLLKFVTSCSRPPLLGFKELDPPFCIQHAGTVDRLPTASTCMNLLKLPEFADEKSMSDKLIYAIQSGSGFELS